MVNPNHNLLQKFGWTKQGETSGFHKYSNPGYQYARIYTTNEGHWQHWSVERDKIRLLHEGIITNLEKHLQKLV